MNTLLPSKVPNLSVDFAFIILSVLAAVFLSKSGLLANLFAEFGGYKLLASFVAGLFFTSAFTIAPAAAMFVEILSTEPVLPTALFGAAGAVLGDLILFRFVRDRLSRDIMSLFKEKVRGRARAFLHSRVFHFVMPALGALIIASPLPDELGITLMGAAHLSMKAFIPISFVFNAIGIGAVALLAGFV